MKRLTKKLILLLSPAVFLWFVACSEDEPPPEPPQALTSPAPPEAYAELKNKADQAKATCAGSLSPEVLMVATAHQSGGPIPMVPPSSQKNCQDDFMNLMLVWATLYGAEANTEPPRKWLMAQVKDIGNKIGANLMAHGITPTPELVQSIAASMTLVKKDFDNRLDSSALPSTVKTVAKAESSYASGGVKDSKNSTYSTAEKPSQLVDLNSKDSTGYGAVSARKPQNQTSSAQRGAVSTLTITKTGTEKPDILDLSKSSFGF